MANRRQFRRCRDGFDLDPVGIENRAIRKSGIQPRREMVAS